MKTTIQIYLDTNTLGFEEYEQISKLPEECKITLLCSKEARQTIPVSLLIWALQARNKIDWVQIDAKESNRDGVICYEVGRLLGKRVRTRKLLPLYLISKDERLHTAAKNLEVLFPSEQYGSVKCCQNIQEALNLIEPENASKKNSLHS
ncbi:hypothetical protein [Allobaculum sp. JKK-2023]|uniref:hypothetical protein n=1 Tax=Allobaculum sp. JKK-2023 TaxID=3108943 RepID=UPI002B053CD5|nr:hypothetical protein [Allobaculum sp. JKK-2023]